KEFDALAEAMFDEKQDWQVRFSAAVTVDVLDKDLANLTGTGRVTREDLDAVLAKGGEATGPFETLRRQRLSPAARKRLHAQLAKPLPDVLAIRAAGKLKDAEAVRLLTPWLKRHEYEYHAAEAAVALGRIGTPQAVAALWQALRTEVPLK